MGEPDAALAPPHVSPSTKTAEGELRFGPFRLYPARRQLFSGDTPLRLGSRAMAILVALAENAGRLMTKEELVRIAWPETFVEEVTLRVHLSSIRRALGDTSDTPRYIANVSGRGYRFIAAIEGQERRRAEPDPVVVVPAQPLPFYYDDLIGRDQAMQTLLDMIEQFRLITLVGPGGIGKTTLAAAAARMLEQRSGKRVGFVDLGTRPDARMLDRQIAEAVNRPNGPGQRAEDRILFLDSCDQMIDEAAQRVEALARQLPDLRIIATSREPLRAMSERVVRLPPLNLPDESALTLEEALTYSAIRMLVDRVEAGGRNLPFSERDTQRLIAISRKLDGLPLAIEMAAAHIQVFGLPEVEKRLQNGMDFLVDGRRTAAPRHRTLLGLLERDHADLARDERLALERLAIFPGSFDLLDATRIAGVATTIVNLEENWFVSALGGLVAKSQLATARAAEGVRYRLPKPLRTFALERLAASPDFSAIARCHAELVLERVRRASAHWTELSRAEWLERHAELAEEVCEALDWCFSEGGAEKIGAELIALAAPVLLRAGKYTEMRRYGTMGLASGTLPPEARFALLLALATMTEDKTGATPTEACYLRQAMRLRRTIGAPWADAKLLVATSALSLRQGRHARALALARMAMERAQLARRANVVRVGRRLAAEAAHYDGDFVGSSALAQTLIADPSWSLPAPFTLLTSPPESAMRVIEARRLWLGGKAQQARLMMFEALSFAAERGPWALCETLGLGLCPLLFWLGEDDRVSTYIEQLDREAGFAGLPHWQSWSTLYRQVQSHIAMREGRRSENALTPRPVSFLQAEIWVTLTGSLRGITQDAAKTSGWCRPECIRARAVASIAAGELDRAETDLQLALDMARKSGALAWELRTTMTLSRLWRHERPDVAVCLLEAVLEQLAEGFGTSDLLAAKALLNRLKTRG